MFSISRNEKNTRMCCVCRKRFQKSELLRVVKTNKGPVLDLDFTIEGRGAYVCKESNCIKTAQKKRNLTRSLKTDSDNGIYEMLSDYMDNSNRE